MFRFEFAQHFIFDIGNISPSCNITFECSIYEFQFTARCFVHKANVSNFKESPRVQFRWHDVDFGCRPTEPVV